MLHVKPRTFRIRQFSPTEFFAEERRRGFLSLWRRISWSGRLGNWTEFSDVTSARVAIQRRKERLTRANEFPIVIESHEWDGRIVLHDARGMSA